MAPPMRARAAPTQAVPFTAACACALSARVVAAGNWPEGAPVRRDAQVAQQWDSTVRVLLDEGTATGVISDAGTTLEECKYGCEQMACAQGLECNSFSYDEEEAICWYKAKVVQCTQHWCEAFVAEDAENSNYKTYFKQQPIVPCSTTTTSRTRTTSLTSTSISTVSTSESTVSTTASTVSTTDNSISDAGTETTTTETVTMTTISTVNFPTANGSIETGTTSLTTMTTTGTFTLAVAPVVVPLSPADARLFATVRSTASFSVSPSEWLLELGAKGRAALQDAVVESVAETLGVPQDQVRAEGVRLGERGGASGGLRRRLEGPSQALDVEVDFAVGAPNKTELSRLEYLVSMWLPDPGSFTFESYIANHLRDVSIGAAITVRGAQFTEAQKACPCAAGFGRSAQCGEDACARCEANEFGGEDGVCQVCPGGTEPSASRDRCQACAQDSAGTKGICSRCPEGSEPTEDGTSCENERGWLGLTEAEWTALGVVAGVIGVLLTLAGLGCWKSFATRGAEQVSSSTRRLASLSSVRSRGSTSTPPQTPGSALSSRSIDSRCIIDILASTGDIDEEDFLEIIRSARSRRRSGGPSLSPTPKHLVAEVAGSPVAGSLAAGRGSRWPPKADFSPRGAGPTASPLSCASTAQSSAGGCGSASLQRSHTTPGSMSLGSSPRSTIAV